MNRDPEGACKDWEKANTLGVKSGDNYVKNECK